MRNLSLTQVQIYALPKNSIFFCGCLNVSFGKLSRPPICYSIHRAFAFAFPTVKMYICASYHCDVIL